MFNRFGDDRFLFQPNIKAKFVLTGLGSVRNWIHIMRHTEQNVDETKCWQITWEAGNCLAYQVNKERDTVGIIWIASKEELTTPSWDCSLMQFMLLRSKLLKKWWEGVFWGLFSPAMGHVLSKGEHFKLSHFVNPSGLEILSVLPVG